MRSYRVIKFGNRKESAIPLDRKKSIYERFEARKRMKSKKEIMKYTQPYYKYELECYKEALNGHGFLM